MNLLKIYKEIIELMVEKGYINSKFILLIISRDEESKIQFIESGTNYQIYELYHIKNYYCGFLQMIKMKKWSIFL